MLATGSSGSKVGSIPAHDQHYQPGKCWRFGQHLGGGQHPEHGKHYQLGKCWRFGQHFGAMAALPAGEMLATGSSGSEVGSTSEQWQHCQPGRCWLLAPAVQRWAASRHMTNTTSWGMCSQLDPAVRRWAAPRNNGSTASRGNAGGSASGSEFEGLAPIKPFYVLVPYMFIYMGT